jgi:hypothetical protein
MGRKSEVIGKELEPFYRLQIQIGNTAQRVGINGSGFKASG